MQLRDVRRLTLVSDHAHGRAFAFSPGLRSARGSIRFLPHVLVRAPVGLVMDALYPVWMVVAVVNRGWPTRIERVIVRVERWVLAIVMHVTLVSNERPKFGLAAYA
jgi:hypothetical protein